MTRAEISQAIDAAVALLQPATRYGRGRLSEFNSIRNEQYPAVWQETLPNTPYATTEFTANQSPLDTAPIRVWVAQWDKRDSLPSQYEKIIDCADLVALKLIYLLKSSITGNVVSSQRSAFVKMNADCLTGVLLEFNILSDDVTVNCE